MNNKILRVVALLGAAALGYLLFWPVPIQPSSWQPPAAMELPENDRLQAIERIASGFGIGPEAVQIDRDGGLLTGYIDGRVVHFDAQGRKPQVLGNTGGRPLGMARDSSGRLIVADAARGLLAIDAARNVRVLASEAGGLPIRFADDLDISADDVVYFSDASTRFGLHQVREDFFEHGPNGRLLSHDLRNGETRVLVTGLYFANGVALGPDDAFVLVNETARYRVQRYWLKGPQAGTAEVFIDGLPGLPDNISFNGRDRYWIALYGPRSAELDLLLPRPFLRKMVYRLPRFLQPDPPRHSLALGVNAAGQVTHNLQYRGANAFAPITSVRESGEWLWFGSLSEPALGRLSLPEPD